MKTSLDRRDRRRAMAVIDRMNSEDILDIVKVRNLIAAALKREREETGFAAVAHLFAKSAHRAALKAFEAKHGKVKQ